MTKTDRFSGQNIAFGFMALFMTYWIGCDFPQPTPSPSMSASPSPAASHKVYALKGWDTDYDAVVEAGRPKMVYGMSGLCPNWWDAAKVNQQKVWNKLWKSIVECESDFKLTSRMIEPKMELDPTTGKKVASEGLTQLSYQDVKNYAPSVCDAISWQKDKGLADSDPAKSIFDPIVNLTCAMHIANVQIEKHQDGGQWLTGIGNYWSCGRPGHKGINLFKAAAPECFQ